MKAFGEDGEGGHSIGGKVIDIKEEMEEYIHALK